MAFNTYGIGCKLRFTREGKTVSATAVRCDYSGTLYLFDNILFVDSKTGNYWKRWDVILKSIVPREILNHCISVREDGGLFRLPMISEVFGKGSFPLMKRGKNRICTRMSDNDIDWWWLDDINNNGEPSYVIGYGYVWSHFPSEKWGIRPLLKKED